MKAKNLRILRDSGIRVPNFIVMDGGSDIDMSFSDAPLFAVRSSFYMEDDDENSFAGQFKTLLNVRRDNIGDAVKEVLESYLSRDKVEKPLSESYRYSENTEQLNKSARKWDGTVESSPVIIQEMIDADISGVMFTANPLGILNEAVITAGYGLGNHVVEDKTETVTYYYNYDERTFYLKENSGVSLNNDILNELVAVSKKIRTIFNKEMDIEFAVKNGLVYILQARPITTLKVENMIILDNSNIVESYPGISLPVTQDFVHSIYRDIFKSCIYRITGDSRLIGEMNDIFDHMVTTYNGSIYYQITNWYEILRLLPCSDRIITIWQEMLGVDNKTVSSSRMKVSGLLKWKIVKSFIHYLLMTPWYMDRLNRYFERVYPRFQLRIKRTDSIPALLKLFDRLEKSITGVWDITLINDMYTFIFTALAGGEKNETIADIKNIESMKPVMALDGLREAVREYGIDSDAYQKKEREYIEEFGDRVLRELKLETRTYRTNPELLKEQVGAGQSIGQEWSTGQEQSTRQEQLTEQEQPTRQERSAGQERLIGQKQILAKWTVTEPTFSQQKDSKEKDSQQITGIRRILGRKTSERKGSIFLVNAAKCGIANREKSRMNRSRLFGLAREILLKIGAILVQNGQIDEKEDVFYLYLDEINTSDKYQKLVTRRKSQFHEYAKGSHPKRIVFANGVIENQRINYNSQFDSVDMLRGTKVSLGKITGEAIVIHEASPGLDVRGKILVTRSTDPGWVFLIRNCGGIIAEQGSILSHTAIISRELKKPAVVDVKDATKVIKSGDLVELNADSGVITILKRGQNTWIV